MKKFVRIIFLPALLTAGYLLSTAHVVVARTPSAPMSSAVSVARQAN